MPDVKLPDRCHPALDASLILRQNRGATLSVAGTPRLTEYYQFLRCPKRRTEFTAKVRAGKPLELLSSLGETVRHELWNRKVTLPNGVEAYQHILLEQ